MVTALTLKKNDWSLWEEKKREKKKEKVEKKRRLILLSYYPHSVYNWEARNFCKGDYHFWRTLTSMICKV